jgi:hypothetical protein
MGLVFPTTFVGIVGVTALGILSKYSIVVQIIVLFAHFIYSKRYKFRRTWIGLAISIFVCIVLISPHLIWLWDQTMQSQGPIYYARNSLEESVNYLTKVSQLFTGFLLTQCFRIAPIALFIYLIKKYTIQKDEFSETLEIPTEKLKKSNTWWQRLSDQDKSFLLFFAIGPTVVTMLIGILLGQKIEAKWAVTFYLGIGMIGAFFATRSQTLKNL